MRQMAKSRSNEISLTILLALFDFNFVFAGDQIRLADIMVLTLYNGRMTNSRRSSAIPHLKCVGGSAGCSSYVPQVVQCYNRGSDGYDVQWECKTDMDNAYRFGRVEVSCEGYAYPEDPYVLRGSCGLEYTLDLTEEGYSKKKYSSHGSGNSYYDYYDGYESSSHSGYYKNTTTSAIGDIIMLALICLIIYAIYKTCLGNNQREQGDFGATGFDDVSSGGSWFGGTSPPPPGFRPEYMPGSDNCRRSTYSSSHYNTGTSGYSGGGFWTGAATGGILGYLLGNTGRRHTGYGYSRPFGSWGSGWGSSFGGNTFSGSSGGRSYSSGTRSASGFGGTRRR